VLLLTLLTSALLLSCAPEPAGNSNAPATASGAATVAEAEKFMADAEKRLKDLSLRAGRASWVQSTFITVDTEALKANTDEDYIEAVTELAGAARRFEGLQMPEALAEQIGSGPRALGFDPLIEDHCQKERVGIGRDE
jgi:peptidyl-dipeptidase A